MLAGTKETRAEKNVGTAKPDQNNTTSKDQPVCVLESIVWHEISFLGRHAIDGASLYYDEIVVFLRS